mgnify:FL=1
MAKGKAAKSESGASMSQYDVEVEARLQALEKQAHPTPTGATQQKVDDRLAALEKAVADISAKCDARATGGSSGGGDRVDKLIDWMTSVPAFSNEMPSHVDEETGQDNHYLDF